MLIKLLKLPLSSFHIFSFWLDMKLSTRMLTTTQQPTAANAWIVKLGSWRREIDTKKPNKTTLGFVVHKNCLTIKPALYKRHKIITDFLSFFFFFVFFLCLACSGGDQSFFFFLFWGEKSTKGDTVFWKWNILSQVFFFLKLQKKIRLKGNTKPFFFGRLSPHLCFTGYLSS